MRAMAQLSRDSAAKNLTKKDLLVELPFCEGGGLRSNLLVCILYIQLEIIVIVINRQRKQMILSVAYSMSSPNYCGRGGLTYTVCLRES